MVPCTMMLVEMTMFTSEDIPRSSELRRHRSRLNPSWKEAAPRPIRVQTSWGRFHFMPRVLSRTWLPLQIANVGDCMISFCRKELNDHWTRRLFFLILIQCLRFLFHREKQRSRIQLGIRRPIFPKRDVLRIYISQLSSCPRCTVYLSSSVLFVQSPTSLSTVLHTYHIVSY
jgi:hypothetical protein